MIKINNKKVLDIYLGNTQILTSYQNDLIIHTGSIPIPEVTIGTQIWSSANLEIDDGLGGILQNDPNYYGKYYNWDAAQRVVATLDGWRLPTLDDWEELIVNHLGDTIWDEETGELMENNALYWNPYFPTTNSTGFNARGGGEYYGAIGSGTWYDVGESCTLWTTDYLPGTDPKVMRIYGSWNGSQYNGFAWSNSVYIGADQDHFPIRLVKE